MFKKAVKQQKKLRLAMSGLSGSGKTYSSLAISSHLGDNPRIALIDTEHESSTLYASKFNFDIAPLDQYHPNKYIEIIKAASQDYDVLIIDSLSHAWLEMLSLVGGNFNNWAKVRPLERNLIETILSSPIHIIMTMRHKTEWADGVDSKGRTTKIKVGNGVVQNSNIEYEFDLAVELSRDDHTMTISKTRFPELEGTRWPNPGQEFAKTLLTILADGELDPCLSWKNARDGLIWASQELNIPEEKVKAIWEEEGKPQRFRWRDIVLSMKQS